MKLYSLHKVILDHKELFTLPCVSIFAPIIDIIKRNNYKKIGLLGTKVTMTNGFYQKALEESGVLIITPWWEDCELIDELIFHHFVKGSFKDGLPILKNIAYKLMDQGVDAIVLACTELPIAFDSISLPIPVIDSMRLHCEAIVNYSLEEE